MGLDSDEPLPIPERLRPMAHDAWMTFAALARKCLHGGTDSDLTQAAKWKEVALGLDYLANRPVPGSTKGAAND